MTIPIIDIFVWAFGLCVGSFLNVAIYRLPLGLSVSKPRWSFCPGCNHTLAWYDNLPLVSWLALRGRCRTCRSEISVQYPLVEAITGLAFVLAYRLLFVFDARVGLVAAAVPTDWPLLLAWLTLVAALIACAGMDIGSYQIDVSVTNLAVVAGIVLLALWPGSRAFVPLATRPTTAGCTAAFLAGVIMLWLTLWRHPMSDTPAESPPKSQQPGSSSLVPGVVAVLVCVGAAIWLSCSSPRAALTPELDGAAGFSFDTWIARVGWAAPVSLAVIFLLMVLAASRDRPADAELHQAIEEEAPHARRAALSELLWLLPCIVAGVLAWLVVGRTAAGGSAWANLVQYAPVAGAVYAMHGAVVGAAAGWIVRIFFTLVFGREAFGVGDIYILAAAGACAGWDIALGGFVFSVGIALVAYIISLALKRTTMIAFGPPLAVGFLMALWLNRPAAEMGRELYTEFSEVWASRPALLAGLLIGSLVVALVAARFARRIIAPAEPEGE